MKGFIVDSTHTLEEGKTIIQLFGRLENGQSFAALIPFKPYLFLTDKDAKKHKKLLGKFTTKKTDLKNFQGQPVTKVSANIQSDIQKLAHSLHKFTSTYESDIKPSQRYVIDNNFLGSIEISGDYTSSDRIDRIYKNPKITPSSNSPDLRILSLDIEADHEGKLFCIGLSSKNYKKCFIISNKKLKNAVSCKSEEDCLEKFAEEVNKLDPDIITGWNFIDFDLLFLQELFRKYKIPFDISRNNSQTRLRIQNNFMRSSSAIIRGRQVLDALNLLRDPFIKEAPSIKKAKFNSYTLEDVSQEVLNKGKLLKGKDRHKEIISLYKKNQQKLVDYNLTDCELVYEILEKTKIIDLTIERSQLTGLTLDKVSGSIAAFDSLYIRSAKKKGLVSPSTHFSKKESRIIGGYVQTPKPGIYYNVLVLDFKSLYPSLIQTFNIDPASLLEKKEKDSIESPNKAYFKNTSGVLPEILKTLHQARELSKKQGKELTNHTIKTIMASFFGVLASPNCRYFNFDMANSITHFGQFIIQLTAKEIEKKFGLKTIYSDTDSVFLETSLSEKEANKLGKEIESYINDFYESYTKKNYNRESLLELEFEKLYLSLMFPKTRDLESAAKKKYAGLLKKNNKELIEITGLEAIRGDWTEAAQEFQQQLLMKVFKKEKIEKFIKSYVKEIKSGKLDKKLIYRKSLRKALSEYTKTTPPHVKAARLLPNLESNVIEYYQTTKGPEPVQIRKHKIDYEHYIKKQIQPIAEQVLALLETDFKDLLQNSKQAKLF